ncbi:MAG: hypothetical protein V5A37_04150 [Halobacteriales archaeon]
MSGYVILECTTCDNTVLALGGDAPRMTCHGEPMEPATDPAIGARQPDLREVLLGVFGLPKAGLHISLRVIRDGPCSASDLADSLDCTVEKSEYTEFYFLCTHRSDMSSDIASLDPRAEMEKSGYDIEYKPHATMAEYNAFYRVEYDGEVIAPPVARRMDVPLNEVWLTEYLRPYEKYILYHELTEIKYRAQEYDVERAHELAVEADHVWEGIQNGKNSSMISISHLLSGSLTSPGSG